MLEQARVGEPALQHNVHGLRNGRVVAFDDVTQARSIWLWILLVCGVAALGAMAWKLARQLKEGGTDQPSA